MPPFANEIVVDTIPFWYRVYVKLLGVINKQLFIWFSYDEFVYIHYITLVTLIFKSVRYVEITPVDLLIPYIL